MMMVYCQQSTYYLILSSCHFHEGLKSLVYLLTHSSLVLLQAMPGLQVLAAVIDKIHMFAGLFSEKYCQTQPAMV